ncbi:MAG: MarP family serine protease [Actinomycetia bacterium]|nr:MarP family serine protease [Actinomycetes bacterium]
MSVIDIVLLVAALLFAITGWRRGLVYGLLSLVGFLTGAAVGLWLAPKVVDSWQDGLPKALTALAIVFVFAALGQVLVGMVGRRLQGAVTWGPMVKLNNVGGAALSVFTMLLVVWFLAGVYATGNSSSLARDVRQSQVIGAVDALMPVEAYTVTGQIQTMYDQTGFPTVFTGLGPEPIKTIGAPDSAILRNEPVVQAAAQTVKILGQAPSCTAGLEGSGFAFAPGRVLTNAHVVAGVKSIQVVTPDGNAVDGEVVYFDPDMDLAVIDAPDLAVRPLTFSDSAARGDNVAVIGYPENGGLEATPARVRDELVAPGNDIYGEGTVVRQVLSLRANVRPGNSGGPVVNKDGQVVGVVFAASLDQDDTGYAMTSRQVASAVAGGLAADKPVSTGPCS